MTRHPEAARMFVLDAHGHTMTVLRDDGPYRHLRFATPGTRMYAYDLITWPGSLCFQGDYGTWVFSRQEDMFAFFAQDTGDINPGYWAEKVTAGETTGYSPDTLRRHVTDRFCEYADEHGWPLASTAECWETIEDGVLELAPEYEDGAREAVRDFTYPYDGCTHPDAPRLEFTDSWEWNLSGFRFQFLWACFAIRHGVNRYRAHRIERADPTAVAIYPALATPPVHRQPDPVRLAPAPPARRAVRWETRQPSEEYL